ncbi:dolichyl pyrophosphate Man9GlcNAc2 alpha-1,3-glucosyltransferase-like isoform X2 [Ostrea edulis]|uniref:dolichyl pyrophosphate Man9GlcNAc2 alpha-1,3-glucosyltransferase-like isoform X2 n=1 Tax=Ostrea edulis TaxID=37623 RepID=UPI0024AFE6AC|nr:dolichyl pyrophosphate Man9GlcNAc2 alpha-1,3-glucosyltransferase-like isoform X2 [Ostrea edulis]
MEWKKNILATVDQHGTGKPPMFGDYEAQRHWMEITFHLPPHKWYFNGTDNNLLYWGLDYPPLTAYHSWLCGVVANKINPSWVALKDSHGHESYTHKLFMRYTVLLADVAIFFPAVILFFIQQRLQSQEKVKLSLVVLLYPGFLLIDHGHFQYNCVSLGLALFGVVWISRGFHSWGSICFSLALNYKQMELYHALPFFCYLLGWCLQKWARLPHLFTIAATVLSTFMVCWLPFLRSKESVLQVVHRVFPLARGLYEDKVANVWCSLSVLIKFKQMFTVDQLVLICLLTTLVLLLPSSVHLLCVPTIRNFRLALVNSSLVFFLFSFHVHEKSILLPALAVSLLVHEHPFWCVWFYIISIFSMLPLFMKDNLVVAAVATTALHCMVCGTCLTLTNRKSDQLWDRVQTVMMKLSIFGAFCLTVASLSLTPPTRYPDLFPVLISVYSCAHFVLFLIVSHILQFQSQTTGIKIKKIQ